MATSCVKIYTEKKLCAKFNPLIWKELYQRNDDDFMQQFASFVPFYKCLNSYIQSKKPIPFENKEQRKYLYRGVCDMPNSYIKILKDAQKDEKGFYCNSYLSTSLDHKVHFQVNHFFFFWNVSGRTPLFSFVT